MDEDTSTTIQWRYGDLALAVELPHIFNIDELATMLRTTREEFDVEVNEVFNIDTSDNEPAEDTTLE